MFVRLKGKSRTVFSPPRAVLKVNGTREERSGARDQPGQWGRQRFLFVVLAQYMTASEPTILGSWELACK